MEESDNFHVPLAVLYVQNGFQLPVTFNKLKTQIHYEGTVGLVGYKHLYWV
jgi:hypothetical protein